jgi:wyosine [tRNA(Phe)-imidazoG37] synthetase (radical SAM superfamily)
VPDLVRGPAPAIDLGRLDAELRQMLREIVQGDFLQQRVAEGARHLEDVAFSGNGEPTSAREFPQAVDMVAQAMRDFGLADRIRLRLITNGSLMDRPEVLAAVSQLARCNGETWFKVDAATSAGIARINDVRLNPQQVVRRLRHCAERCPTWVQTCMFALDGTPPAEAEISAWLELLAQVASQLAGVHLYGLARPSMQPEAPRLSRLPEAWMEQLADRARQLGLTVQVSP